ncbi:MAG: hypothetical protein JWN39_128 [Ilumatobacteraceae bacterium]|nr:hypothetical protein [Ilumatobacteraceae bacterium]
MRACGTVHTVGGREIDDHLCWGYSDASEFGERAAEFLAEGLVAGQRIMYRGLGTVEEMYHDLRRLGDLDGLIRLGALVVAPMSDSFSIDSPDDPESLAQDCADATAVAVADGFTGLRAVGDCTLIITDPQRRDAFVRREHLVDRFMAEGHGFTAMCGYDTRVVDHADSLELAATHPLSNDISVPFRMFAPDAHADLAIAGDIDTHGIDLFRRSLDRVVRPPFADSWVIDAVGVTFLDHRMLQAINDRARTFNSVAVLQVRNNNTAAELVEMLQLECVRIVEW